MGVLEVLKIVSKDEECWGEARVKFRLKKAYKRCEINLRLVLDQAAKS